MKNPLDWTTTRFYYQKPFMNPCVLSVFFLFFAVNIFAPNPFLRLPVVDGLELTYNDLIAYLNYSEHLPNNQINPNHLPTDSLINFRQRLHARVNEKHNPEYECLEAILAYAYSIYSEDETEIIDLAIIEISLKCIWEQLEIIREIVPDSFRSPESPALNPRDFLDFASEAESGSGTTSSSRRTSTATSGSDYSDLRIDADTLSAVSSRAMTPTPEELIKCAFGLSPASPGSSQSYGQNFF